MIHIIFTGGTIASSVISDNKDNPNNINNNNTTKTVDINPDNKYKLISMFKEKQHIVSPVSFDFSFSYPYEILSENLELSHLLRLVSHVKKVLNNGDKKEGIIITHGTDTLVYTAAFLSYIFSDIEIPIVLVSANYILDDPRSNGLSNFTYAACFIRENMKSYNKSFKGVFVSYVNEDGVPMIHRGNRILIQEAFKDSINSKDEDYIGLFMDNNFLPNPAYFISPINQNSFPALNAALDMLIHSNEAYDFKGIEGNILFIKPHPGLTLNSISLDNYSAILLEGFHSGTLGATSELDSFLKKARVFKIPVFCCGIKRDGTEYDSINKYKEKGVIPLYDKTPVSQYIKLNILSILKLSITENMLKDFAEEC
ncbi:MAG: asparaginase [Lachnospiraceae bacterium]|nr:asparaginase [Lachnospiraceae bacterium]